MPGSRWILLHTRIKVCGQQERVEVMVELPGPVLRGWTRDGLRRAKG